MFKTTPLIMVEDAETLASVVEMLKSEPAIAVDTEADSLHHFQEKLCLIQISDPHRDYIVDPLKVPDLSPLQQVFSNPDQVKVLHGADYDVVSLKRDHRLETRNIFDTMLASQFLGFPHIGLADLIERFFGIEIDKRYQRHDWASRPLLPEHLDYARGDTHWLLALREIMSYKLEKAGRLEHVLEECQLIEAREWGGRIADPTVDFLRIRGAVGLDDVGLRILRAVVVYRSEQARQMDRPAFKVIPDDRLLELAFRRPSTPEDVAAILKVGSPLHRRHGAALHEAVQRGVSDPTPLPDRRREASPRQPVAAGGGERLLGPLKEWRNQVVRSLGYNPAVVANNTLLKEVARLAPASLEELSQVPGIRSWQLKDFGEQIVEVVRKNMSDRPAPRARRKRTRRRRSGDTPAT